MPIMIEIYDAVKYFLADTALVWLLLAAAMYFTWITRGVQFRMVGEMIRLLVHSGKRYEQHSSANGKNNISSFQAFMVSIASRVGTGNLAGVATAIALGGPGAVFWMWIIALLGAATAFVESTLAQLYKRRSNDSFVGGPAYYILHGLKKRWWAITFAVLITLTFGIAFNAVQSNTIASAFSTSFGIDTTISGILLASLTLIVVWGGIRSIAKFSEIVVPVMAIAYILLAIGVIAMNLSRIPEVMSMIVSNAFGVGQATGGAIGMAMMMGIKRGLFSNEAGEGSTPNAAATATVSHPVKQGLIQSLGVYTDTLLVCSATAFIILCSDVWYTTGSTGIALTQQAIDAELGAPGIGAMFISVAIFFFAFTSIVANYYYGEANLVFISHRSWVLPVFRFCVTAVVMIGAVRDLDSVWGFADITMAAMTICNLAAILMLGKYAVRCMRDYMRQRRDGKDPAYHTSVIPEIAEDTPCWDS